MKSARSNMAFRADSALFGFIAAAIATFAFGASGEAAANQTSLGNAAEGRAWAEALANVSSWNGEWHIPIGADLVRPANYVVENGAIFVVNGNGGGLKKRVDNITFVRTYREGVGLVHEYSVTCTPQFGNPHSGKLIIKTGFRGPKGDGSYSAFPTISSSSCGITAIVREGPAFSANPYPYAN